MMTLNELKLKEEYRIGRERIFDTSASLEWYIRKNKKALVDGGALLMITGRWFIDAAAFDKCVIKAGKENSGVFREVVSDAQDADLDA